MIFGVGLIGGSLARALRERGEVDGERTVIGVGRSAASSERALELGVIDGAAALNDDAALRAALSGADFVLLAAPVAQTQPLLERIAPFLDAGTIVTDAGSTKSDVVAAARAALGARIGQFVPGHPIAGRESSGVDAALPDLYVEPQRRAVSAAGERAASGRARRGDVARDRRARAREMTPSSTTACSRRSAICRMCCRSRWSSRFSIRPTPR